MTGGGDLDEIEDDEPGATEGDAGAPAGVDLDLNDVDRDPTAGGSDIGGRAGDPDDDA